MTVLSLLKFPDARLHQVARPVTAFDDALQTLTANMLETMYACNGVGLAATQVDVHQRVVVIDVSDERNQPLVFVNPELLDKSRETKPWEEGCLSVPEVYETIERPASVRVRAQDVQGQVFELDCADLLAVCIQHEIDHLNGKVFIQHLSQLKFNRLRTKIRKAQAGASA